MHDWQLLREYVEHNSQTAFATLVERHANLVYSTCLREVQDTALAEDVAQVVFVILARKAASLREGTVITGWLFQTARFACKNALKQEKRRRQREQKAAEEMMSEMQSDKTGWANLEPLLHDGLAALAAQERDAVLLRFFENRSLRDTGAALGISEDAARMRVSRALEKLRRHFARHGYAASVALLGALLSEHAVHAAPASYVTLSAQLPHQVASNANAIGGAHSTLNPQIAMLSHGVLRSMALKKATMTAGISALLIGGGVFTHHMTKAPSQQTEVALSTTIIGPSLIAPVQQKERFSQASPQTLPIAPLFTATPAPIIEPTPSAPVVKTSDERQFNKDSQSLAMLQRAAKHTNAVKAPLTVNQSKTPDAFAPVVAQPESAEPASPPTSGTQNTAARPKAPKTTPDSAADSAKESIVVPVFGTEATEKPASVPVGPTFVLPNIGSPENRSAIATRGNKLPRRNGFASNSELRGRILGINESDGSLLLKAPGEAEKTILIPAATKIFVDNKTGALEDIQVGMNARIRLSDEQSAIVIRARAPLFKASAPRPFLIKPPKEAKKKKNKN